MGGDAWESDIDPDIEDEINALFEPEGDASEGTVEREGPATVIPITEALETPSVEIHAMDTDEVAWDLFGPTEDRPTTDQGSPRHGKAANSTDGQPERRVHCVINAPEDPEARRRLKASSNGATIAKGTNDPEAATEARHGSATMGDDGIVSGPSQPSDWLLGRWAAKAIALIPKLRRVARRAQKADGEEWPDVELLPLVEGSEANKKPNNEPVMSNESTGSATCQPSAATRMQALAERIRAKEAARAADTAILMDNQPPRSAAADVVLHGSCLSPQPKVRGNALDGRGSCINNTNSSDLSAYACNTTMGLNAVEEGRGYTSTSSANRSCTTKPEPGACAQSTSARKRVSDVSATNAADPVFLGSDGKTPWPSRPSLFEAASSSDGCNSSDQNKRRKTRVAEEALT